MYKANYNVELMSDDDDIYWSLQYTNAAEAYLYLNFDRIYEEEYLPKLFDQQDVNKMCRSQFEKAIVGSYKTQFGSQLFGPKLHRSIFRERFDIEYMTDGS